MTASSWSYEARDALDIRSRPPLLRISWEAPRPSESSLATNGYIGKKVDSREVVTRQELEFSHMLGIAAVAQHNPARTSCSQGSVPHNEATCADEDSPRTDPD